jgi:2,4-dienoyl-CoA reductase-like NADH-dependent reductase (Old Yellow Enzyme family)
LDSTAELLRRMAADEFDLIAVGRALISNPNWPLKVLDKNNYELKPSKGTTRNTGLTRRWPFGRLLNMGRALPGNEAIEE